MQHSHLRATIFDSGLTFEEKTEVIFNYQVKKNPVYKQFAGKFGFTAANGPPVDQIPLLPVRAFRETRVSTQSQKAALYFESSGTSGMQRAVHEVPDPGLYRESILKGFVYNFPGNPVIFAFIPGYTDNPHSSLVWMLQTLVKQDESGLSRFINQEDIPDFGKIDFGQNNRQIILFGAAFGLFDLVENDNVRLPEESIVIETGGMKTHRREISRDQLYDILAEGFELPKENIYSEYGMCEMLSQAYASVDGLYEPVPWLKITVRDPDDPGRICDPGEEGLIGVIDLANLYSCSFLLTGDRGVEAEPGRYRILGRWNPADLRGCNFLVDRD